ncbi:MAG: DUF928 domain-containing protein [Leptolyngbya sp. SIO3F4]|nr:DUF928 domain-containing protein [Leptolyngbya sp. SIO3F4]
MSSPYLVQRIISFGSAVAILLVLTPASLAGRNDRPSSPSIPGALRAYTPPSDARRPSRDHTGGSVRGCGDDIVAIAPRLNSVGQTASTNPTFVWYNFSPDSDPIEFQLYRIQPDESLEVVTIKQFDTSQQGYTAYTLPTADAKLNVGETYMWQVVLYCDTAFENPGHYSSAELEVVDLPADVGTSLTNDPLQNAQIYANASLWYDAIAEVAVANSATTQTFRQDLLLDLASLEEQSTKENAIALSTQLREIAGIE